jgi:hypothetical protein
LDERRLGLVHPDRRFAHSLDAAWVRENAPELAGGIPRQWLVEKGAAALDEYDARMRELLA